MVTVGESVVIELIEVGDKKKIKTGVLTCRDDIVDQATPLAFHRVYVCDPAIIKVSRVICRFEAIGQYADIGLTQQESIPKENEENEASDDCLAHAFQPR